MVKLMVNGQWREIDADADMPLLWVLRDLLGMTGTKFGCGMALCGACTVHLDGQPVRSCVTPLAAVGRRRVVTIEGVTGPVSAAVQSTWVSQEVAQCGYCQSGQIMTAIALLHQLPRASDADIDKAMAGNICRCATYGRIRSAVHVAAKKLKA